MTTPSILPNFYIHLYRLKCHQLGYNGHAVWLGGCTKAKNHLCVLTILFHQVFKKVTFNMKLVSYCTALVDCFEFF